LEMTPRHHNNSLKSREIMADSNDPYRRLGTNSWQELLDQVNNVLQNPPTGCDPIAPVDAPDPEHKWAKADITEVHEQLNLMPGNCFTFQDIPDKWKVSIIEDIEDQLSNAWCDCGEECVAECSNAQAGRVYTYNGSLTATDCGPNIPGGAIPGRNAMRDAFLAGWNARWILQDDWSPAYIALCDLQAELEDLEDELTDLEDELTALEALRDTACAIPGPSCDAAQALVDAKQIEVDDKQDEVDLKQDEVDTQQALVDGFLAAADAYALDSMAHAVNAVTVTATCGDSVLGNIPVAELVDYACDELGPDCLPRDPLRCEIFWELQEKTSRISEPTSEGIWLTQTDGYYTPSGLPYITDTSRIVPCTHPYACLRTDCSDNCEPTVPPSDPLWNPAPVYFREYRSALSYAPPGEECCD
jgi:hypothetical protein